MKILIRSCGLLLAIGCAQAEPVREDFAYGYRINTPQAGAIYELVLPEPVYSNVVRADLGDIAIFNAAGETVPYAFRGAIEARPVAPAPVSLPFYPLYEGEQRIPQPLSLRLRADFQGALIELDSNRPAQSNAVVAYILDADKVNEPIKRLSIDWTSPEDNLITRVQVQSSDDLSHWTTLTSSAALARLDYAGNRLTQNHIEIPRRQARYLKISWPAGNKGAAIIAVRAEFAARNGTQQRVRNLYTGKRADTEQDAGFEYALPGYLPVEEINLKLEQVNSLLQGAVWSRASPDQDWRLRYRGLFYRLQFPEAELQNPSVAIATTSDRYWRVAYDRESSSLGAAMPVLEVGWKPHRLVFLARGEGPFSLLYGSARAQAQQAPVNSLIEDLKKAMDTLPVQAAETGEAITGNLESLSPPPPPLPWRIWLLWSSLVIGVLVLGVLAWRLYRQL